MNWIGEVTEKNIERAARIHSISRKESHKEICSRPFLDRHTIDNQIQYILRWAVSQCSGVPALWILNKINRRAVFMRKKVFALRERFTPCQRRSRNWKWQRERVSFLIHERV